MLICIPIYVESITISYFLIFLQLYEHLTTQFLLEKYHIGHIYKYTEYELVIREKNSVDPAR